MELAQFVRAHLRERTLVHVVGCRVALLFGAVLADEHSDFGAGEFAAEFGLAGLDGGIALLRALQEPFEQVRGYFSWFEASLASLDPQAKVMKSTGERVAVDFVTYHRLAPVR